jgi:hypothetical protein
MPLNWGFWVKVINKEERKMIRATFMSGRWLGININSIEDDFSEIKVFADEGTPVLILDDESDVDFEIEMVELE